MMFVEPNALVEGLAPKAFGALFYQRARKSRSTWRCVTQGWIELSGLSAVAEARC